jgi:hypothetical protein
MCAEPSIGVDAGGSVVGTRLADIVVCDSPDFRAVPVAITGFGRSAMTELGRGFGKGVRWEGKDGDGYEEV